MDTVTRRNLLAATAAIGTGIVLTSSPSHAQHEGGVKGPPRGRTARTTRLFKAPQVYPNALAVAPEGVWIGQQLREDGKPTPGQPPKTGPEKVWLMDWNGKLLKSFEHAPCNTSGLAYGDGKVYVLGNHDGANGAYIFDTNGKLLDHKPMPLGGGGCHGGQWYKGKLWLVANRMNALIRVDPISWTPEFGIPIYTGTPDTLRWHDMTFDDQGHLWLITGNDSTSPESGRAGLARYDAETGKCLEYVGFAPGSADPHGLGFHNGKLVSSDAGHHPGWADQASKDSGWVFSIDIA